MNLTLRLVASNLLAFVVAAMAGWGALALWFTLPIAEEPRGALALAFATLGVGVSSLLYCVGASSRRCCPSSSPASRC